MGITGVGNYYNPSNYSAYSNSKKGKNAQINTGKTDVRIAPEILNKMSEDSQSAAKYEHMLSKIPALDRWADSMIKSMTGSEVKYRQVWIDKDGNMGSMCVTGPSEEQQKKNEDKKTEEKREREQSVKLSISRKGMEYYRNCIQQNEQENCDEVLQQREIK